MSTGKHLSHMKHLRSVIFAAAAFGAAFTSAHAQQQPATRIGYVNTERILRDAVPAKAAQQKLEQEFSKRDKDLQEMAARLKAMGERNERDAAVMNESDRMRRQREFAELEKEFQRKQREFREDLNQRRNEELSQVVEKANRAIRQIAEEEKYDFILQEAVYASPRVDITEKVLRALGAPNGK
ncbi:MAG: OmpH family outer membrane protein [Gammaproteobacteria bacterium]|jgi:outer membrane protein